MQNRPLIERTSEPLYLSEEELKEQEKYLKDVFIVDKNEKQIENSLFQQIKRQILNQDIIHFVGAKQKIKHIIDKVARNYKSEKIGGFYGMRTLKKIKNSVKNKSFKRNYSEQQPHNISKWIYCEKHCVKVLYPLINKETRSTAFMLRILAGSVIDTTGKLPLKFKYDNPENEPLSGIWMDSNIEGGGDHRFFKLCKLDPSSDGSRLIMGFGPSASGKTYWAENIIKMIQNNQPSFPRSFLSVDGGLVRELSFIYQKIIEMLEINKISGFKNLVSAGLDLDPFHKSLFKAGKIKKNIQKYLITQQKNDETFPVSLYVPETLGSPKGFTKNVIPYINITGDDNNWIGLYIWQNKTEDHEKDWELRLKNKYSELQEYNLQGMSTTTSGKSRELKEGKKYSITAYDNSKRNGMIALKKAPGGRIDIHNSGGKKTIDEMGEETYNKSLITEYRNAHNIYILENLDQEEYKSIYRKKELNDIGQLGGNKTKRNRTKRKKYTKKKNI